MGTETPGIEAEPLTRWFEANVEGSRPPLAFELIAGGRSNLTYRVTDSAGRRWALRRPPLHGVLGSAHDVAREHRCISALGPTDVPVPNAVVLCEDTGVIGAPFFVMDFVDGVVLRDEELEAGTFAPQVRSRASFAMVETLAALHAVRPADVGLGDLGRQDGYIARQLKRWRGQLEQSTTREMPMMDEAHARLSEAIPEQGPATIVHGDYRLDNMILSEQGEVAAVLDWELCTLGDPMADVGLLVVYWNRPWGVAPGNFDGFPPVDDLIERYGQASGRDLSQLDFYVAFGSWKLAAIIEGVYARYASGAYGEEAKSDADDMPQAVDGLAEASLRRLDQLARS
jgi:aminoglycoside phosphotransferase (APT) family kinase protein